jgi:hypothetical protein
MAGKQEKRRGKREKGKKKQFSEGSMVNGQLRLGVRLHCWMNRLDGLNQHLIPM